MNGNNLVSGVAKSSSPGPGGVHPVFSTKRPPLGQSGTTAPASGTSNTGTIVAGILVPAILIGIGLLIFYIWYRRKYPVRMVMGRDFTKFSNPKYNKRASTMTLVRDDAESAWEIPDTPKQREHSLSLVKENETDNEQDKQKIVQGDKTEPDIQTVTSTEVNANIEITPPPRNIARERPKKAKLVKAMELADDLSESAFEIVTESDLGKRTDSDISSGNDSTETHTVSLSFKETFDNRHRNTVSIVTNDLDGTANERIEHRANSLPPELKGSAEIQYSGIKDSRLSKSTGNEISQVNKENIINEGPSQEVKRSSDAQGTDEHLHANSHTDTQFREDNEINPFDNTDSDINNSFVIIGDNENITNENITETVSEIAESVTVSAFPKNQNLFENGFDGVTEKSIEQLSLEDDSVVRNEEIKPIKEEIVVPEPAESDMESIPKSDNGTELNDTQKKTTSERDKSVVLVAENDSEALENATIQAPYVSPEIIDSDQNKTVLGSDEYSSAEMKAFTPLDNGMLSFEQLNSETSNKDQNSVFESSLNSSFDIVDSTKFDSPQEDESKEKEGMLLQSIPAVAESITSDQKMISEESSSEIRRTSLIIKNDTLFLDAPPTPMIVVRDSYIQEPQADSPILLDIDIQDKETGLPVIKEKSESQTSTRSNSFDFDFSVSNENPKMQLRQWDEYNKGMVDNETQQTITTLHDIKNINPDQSLLVSDQNLSESTEENMKSKEEITPSVPNSGTDTLRQACNDDMSSMDNSLLLTENMTGSFYSDSPKGEDDSENLVEESLESPEVQCNDNNEVNKMKNHIDSSLDTLLDIPLPVVPTGSTGSGATLIDDRSNSSLTFGTGIIEPLEILVNTTGNDLLTSGFNGFEGDNTDLLTSPVGVSTDSSGISWELVSDNSPENGTLNLFETTSVDEQRNEINKNIGVDNEQAQMNSGLDFETDGSLILKEQRKPSDSSSSREGDISWEVIDESADSADKLDLPGFHNDDDMSFA